MNHSEILKHLEIKVNPRGIGLGKRQGEQYKFERYQKNCTFYVNSKSDGLVVMEMLYQILGRKIGSYLDYREHEPNHIQIKLFEIDGIDIDILHSYTSMSMQDLIAHTNKDNYIESMNEQLTCVKCGKSFDPGKTEPHLVTGPIGWLCNHCFIGQ